MGCAASKQELGRKMKAGRRPDLEIGWPKDFHHNSLSYPSTLCVDCSLPSRTLLASLGNTDTTLCCSCDSARQIPDLKPLSPLTLSSKRELPTSYNFDFGFNHASKGYHESCDCIEDYYDEYDDEQDCEAPSHKRFASFSSDKWKVENKVVVTAQEVVSCSRSNSYASSECLKSTFEADNNEDGEPFLDDSASTLGSESFGPKLRIWGKLPFETLNQSSPDLLSASARKSQRVSKDQVKVVRIRGSKSTNWI
ncbi:hypothetical protein ABW20_dc0103365 [Dactylellina cionopaga]|nr:hypothetical protein ABW20_dc0103365 [Dactylellina cionopaga]